jgi:CRP/FNR family transcriptional regulator, cyclic AMP receptor protein
VCSSGLLLGLGSLLEARSLIESLRTKTFLGALPDEALEAVAKLGRVKHYEKNQIIFERGERGDYMLILLSGRVKISNLTADAHEVVLNLLGPGDLNGEIALLDGGERTATATVLEDTSAFLLFRRDLLPVLKEHPNSLIEIVATLCDKLRQTSLIVEDIQRSMQSRFARAILRLVEQHGRQTGDGILIDFELSQRDLGSYAGLSRENTSRLMGMLSKSNIAMVKDGKILIKDAARLRTLADGSEISD